MGSGPDRCVWCRRPLPPGGGPGRPRRFCKQSCRQRDYEARRRARLLGLTEHELIVTRQRLDALLDHLFVVKAAVDDIDRDLGPDLARLGDATELRDALQWLLGAIRPLVEDTTDLTA